MAPSVGPRNSQNLGSRAARDASEGDLALPETKELQDAIASPEVSPSAATPARIERTATPGDLDRLIRDLQSGLVDGATLAPETRRAVVAYLAETRGPPKEGQKIGKIVTKEMLARLLKVSVVTISNDLTKIRKRVGTHLMKTWGPEGAIGFLERNAEASIRELRDLGDPMGAFMVANGFVKSLKDLGAFGGRDDGQAGFRVTFETVGPNLERLTRQLEDAFRPELTGERPKVVDGRSLPLPSAIETEEKNEGGVSPPNGEDTAGLDDPPPLEVSGDPPA